MLQAAENQIVADSQSLLTTGKGAGMGLKEKFAVINAIGNGFQNKPIASPNRKTLTAIVRPFWHGQIWWGGFHPWREFLPRTFQKGAPSQYQILPLSGTTLSNIELFRDFLIL